MTLRELLQRTGSPGHGWKTPKIQAQGPLGGAAEPQAPSSAPRLRKKSQSTDRTQQCGPWAWVRVSLSRAGLPFLAHLPPRLPSEESRAAGRTWVWKSEGTWCLSLDVEGMACWGVASGKGRDAPLWDGCQTLFAGTLHCDQGWTWPLPPSGVSTYKGSGPNGPHPRQRWGSQCEEGALAGGP